MLSVRLFGKPEIYLKDEVPVVFPTLQGEAIFCYLLLVKRPVLHTKIASLFWPELPVAAALAAWHKLFSLLQKLTGDSLSLNSKQVTFHPQLEDWVDFYELEQLLANDKVVARERLSRLMTLYQDELLVTHEASHGANFATWLLHERQLTRQMVMDIVRLLSEQFLQDADFNSGLKATQWWLKLEPMDEFAHRLRMRFFWQSKQRSAAILQYNICCEALQQQANQEPGEETTQLYLQILQDEIPLASYNQTQRPAQPTRILHNLPTRLTTIIGREKEIEAILHFLLQQRQPLVSIVGEGGIGKTSLALAVAWQLVADLAKTPYIDGVWFVPCAGIDDNLIAQEQLVINIGTAIGMQFQGRKNLSEQLAEYLSNKAMLLLIDNFEHLTEHTQSVVALLQQSKGLQLLFTTRHELEHERNQSLRLDGLEISAFVQHEATYVLTQEEVAQLRRIPSVSLLEERGKRVWDSFAVDAENGVTVAKLCKLLDGNPLALELAATLLYTSDIATILSELTENYALLAADLHDLPPRQRSIHNTIDYAWRLLSSAQATLLARCSVFRGAFSYQAVATIAGVTAERVTELVQRSLLHEEGQQRLYIHEMVRQFAAKKLAQDQADALATFYQHSEYYLALLRLWWDNTESRHIVTRLPLSDLDNIHAAWETAFLHQHYAPICHAIIAYTQYYMYAGLYWNSHFWIDLYYQKLQEQLATTDADKPPDYQELQTALTYASGVFSFYLGNHSQATEWMLRALALVQQDGYFYLASNIERFLGHLSHISQKMDEAEFHYTESIRHAQEQKQPYSEITPLLGMAFTMNQRGQPNAAVDYLQKAHDLLQKYPDVTMESLYHKNYGDLHHNQGRWTDAVASLQKTIQVGMNQATPTHHYHNLSRMLWQSGRFELAKEYLERVEISRKDSLYFHGRFWHTAWLIEFANLYHAWEQPEQSLFYSQQARSVAQKSDWKLSIGQAMKVEGGAQLQLEQWDIARENLTHSLALFRQESAVAFECTALTQLIRLHLLQEDEEKIITYSENIWELLHSGKLDMTNAEPIKAWWVCFLAFRATGDARAEVALRTAAELFSSQLAQIHDEAWRSDFTNQIPEHKQLTRVVSQLYPSLWAV